MEGRFYYGRGSGQYAAVCIPRIYPEAGECLDLRMDTKGEKKRADGASLLRASLALDDTPIAAAFYQQGQWAPI